MVTETTFLEDVRHEIDMLKQHATADELSKLDLRTFSAQSPRNCIYGQMTGKCTSFRAKELMDKSCRRVMNANEGIVYGTTALQIPLDKAIEKGLINGEYKAQTWGEVGDYDDDEEETIGRDYAYLSALEGYICTTGANIPGIIAYMTNKTDRLAL